MKRFKPGQGAIATHEQFPEGFRPLDLLLHPEGVEALLDTLLLNHDEAGRQA